MKYKMGGAVIYGVTNYVNSEEKCNEVLDYLNNILGPTVLQVIQESNSKEDSKEDFKENSKEDSKEDSDEDTTDERSNFFKKGTYTIY